jgi:hypothetical protein
MTVNRKMLPGETPTQYSDRVARESSDANAMIGGVDNAGWKPTAEQVANAKAAGHIGDITSQTPHDYYAVLAKHGLTSDEICDCEKLTEGGYRVTLIRGGVVRDLR